ncbi:MAG TPA: hypothetical protein VLS28_08720 [Candidatus Sulfomarinibacteraceae bacterium]|nr:hypothetical protein [Candidatus Sulfomarinibacteraceae bacterium]
MSDPVGTETVEPGMSDDELAAPTGAGSTGTATGTLDWPAADTIHDPLEPANDASEPGAVAAGDPGKARPGTAASVTRTEAPARQRRDNPLVAGLVKAMRDAATATRQDAASRFAEEAKARVEAIHVHSADAAAALRKQADADILEIRDWSKAEIARVREATDSRIAARRQVLESDVEALSARVEHRIEEVRGAITAFEQQMDAFFERLLAEEDPARVAGLAQQLPEPPVLEIDISEPAGTMAVLDPDGAAAAEAEALGEIDTLADDGSDDPAEADVDVIPDVAGRLDALAGHAAATPDPVTTRVAVTGLASVASIAGFKRALAKAAGVRAVSVASGPTGDFVFTVTHESGTDLRSVVPQLDGFAAVITGDANDVITVTATDPERAH